jgi:hypothetical protein
VTVNATVAIVNATEKNVEDVVYVIVIVIENVPTLKKNL